LSGGVDLGIAHNNNLSEDVLIEGETHSRVGIHIKGHIDYLIAPRAGLGVTGYVNATVFPAKSRFSGNDLQTPTLGAGVFKDFRVGKKMALSAMGGVAFAFIGFDDANSSTDGSDSFFSFAVHLEASLKIDLAPRHAIVITPVSLDIFMPALTDSDSGITPEDAGFDKTGSTYAFTVGYLGRFGASSP